MTNKIVFDDKAHSIISELIDNTEDWVVRHWDYPPQSANAMLCLEYLEQCANVLFGAQWYNPGEERCGTEIYLLKLRGATSKLRSRRRLNACIDQLLEFPQLYFHNYLTVLRAAYLAELPKLKCDNQVVWSGLVKIAAANLPGVRNDVRRHLRSLGATTDFIIINDRTIERKEARFTRTVFPMNIDNTSESGG